MTTHERRLIRFLSDPASYPHSVHRIERFETHVSHVFVAGEFAYKIKKAVKFPFIDASTLTRRRAFCRLEMSLNRRLAPSLYLGVVPIVETARGLRLGARGRVIEYAVKMRRLPQERMLDRLIATRSVRTPQVRQIGDQLARFFTQAGRSRVIDRYGRPKQVAQLVLGNLQECGLFVGELLSEAQRRRLEHAYRQFLALREPVLTRRLREGRIIDGHGDLRCENICLTEPVTPPPVAAASGGGAHRARPVGPSTGGGVTIFDCVEFQPAFRCGDQANDLAFLLMDMECRGREDLADIVLVRYRAAIDDPTLDIVLPFYQCHRSLVRGKVRGLAWRQHPRSAEGRRLRGIARRHFEAAVAYARRFAPPRLVVVTGLIGTGKSTTAGYLAQTLGAAWLRTDEIRLTQFLHLRSAPQEFAEGLYAPRVSAMVYQRLLEQAEAIVRQGGSVVCDGTFSKAEGREALRRIAKRHGASFHLIECVAPKAVVLRRIAARLERGRDLSEARPEHYERLKAEFEPMNGWPRRLWTRLKSGGPSGPMCRAALKVLQHAWVESERR